MSHEVLAGLNSNVQSKILASFNGYQRGNYYPPEVRVIQATGYSVDRNHLGQRIGSYSHWKARDSETTSVELDLFHGAKGMTCLATDPYAINSASPDVAG